MPRPLLALRESCQLENSRKDSEHQGEVDSDPNPSISHYCVIFITVSVCPSVKWKGKYFLHSGLCQFTEY